MVEGEHVLVHLRKTGYKTPYVAEARAAFSGIPFHAVSYAGLKDRPAVTEQWFFLHLPGKSDPDFTAFQLAGCDILAAARHLRKLRIGALKGNAFILTLALRWANNALRALKTVAKAALRLKPPAARFSIRCSASV